MKNANRSLFFFGLASAGLCAGAILVGMTNHRPSVANPTLPSTETNNEAISAVFSSKVLDAKDVLAENLMRRFTDRQNISFGMSRIIRPEDRVHAGPTMNKYEFPKWRKTSGGEDEYLAGGRWMKFEQIKPSMRAENESEREAIQRLTEEKVDVAIYTMGLFHKDKGVTFTATEATAFDEPGNYQDESWQSSNSLRIKGPAYLSQDAESALASAGMANFGRKAWASGKDTFTGEGKDGWKLFASRVAAPDMSCAKCHSDAKVKSKGEFQKQGGGPKKGDGIGIFIIAMRNP